MLVAKSWVFSIDFNSVSWLVAFVFFFLPNLYCESHTNFYYVVFEYLFSLITLLLAHMTICSFLLFKLNKYISLFACTVF